VIVAVAIYLIGTRASNGGSPPKGGQ
jgi:hypothetical protein